ncbi:hypothetical protein [Lacticaseibacillus hulanensis]|uniref:hypothetical protein n=1 Tax=Lacticaseibacillus hulanensis TaxID=2493111 RepID=UPI000FD89F4F|nr:hypothetical protein [Lacticaseibacillus hulanensis]
MRVIKTSGWLLGTLLLVLPLGACSQHQDAPKRGQRVQTEKRASKPASTSSQHADNSWSARQLDQFAAYMQSYAQKQGVGLTVATNKHPQNFAGYTWPKVYNDLEAKVTGRDTDLRTDKAVAQDAGYFVQATYALTTSGKGEPYAIYALVTRAKTPELMRVEVADKADAPYLSGVLTAPGQLDAALAAITAGKTVAAPKREPLRNQYDAVALLERKIGMRDADGEFSWRVTGSLQRDEFTSNKQQYYLVRKIYNVQAKKGDGTTGSVSYGAGPADSVIYYVNAKSQAITRGDTDAGAKIAAGRIMLNSNKN